MITYKTILASSFVVLGFALAGCQTTSPAPLSAAPQVATPQPDAPACSKCVLTQTQSPAMTNSLEVSFYQTRQQMTCPDCRDAATNLFTRGKMEHSCRTCALEQVSCKAHQQPAVTADRSRPAAGNLDWPLW